MENVAVKDVLSSDGTTLDIAIASTATVYTHSVKVDFSRQFALFYKAAAVGTPDLKIELEEGYALPTTEGDADSNWCVPKNMSNIETNLTVKTQQAQSLSPIVSPCIRFKITGNAANPADTTIRIRLAHFFEF